MVYSNMFGLFGVLVNNFELSKITLAICVLDDGG
jgi:hypothetical protein